MEQTAARTLSPSRSAPSSMRASSAASTVCRKVTESRPRTSSCAARASKPLPACTYLRWAAGGWGGSVWKVGSDR